jgi:hypothetical protein
LYYCFESIKNNHMNIFAILVAAIVPMTIGLIWYSNTIFGKAWMASAGLSEEQLKSGNMLIIFGVSLLLSFFFAMSMPFMVIHQAHVDSMLNGQTFTDVNTEVGALYKTLMEKFGTNFRTFKHGALHGFMSSIFIALPIIGMNALFERKSFKYIFIHAGYWAVVMTIMGAIVCGWK